MVHLKITLAYCYPKWKSDVFTTILIPNAGLTKVATFLCFYGPHFNSEASPSLAFGYVGFDTEVSFDLFLEWCLNFQSFRGYLADLISVARNASCFVGYFKLSLLKSMALQIYFAEINLFLVAGVFTSIAGGEVNTSSIRTGSWRSTVSRGSSFFHFWLPLPSHKTQR